ncbi:MAG: carboxypeptidase-like regulatory domain-containing protein [Bacteroidota bacterium]
MKPLLLSLVLLIWLVQGVADAQPRSVSGIVVDAETNQPVPFAHVFISNTTHVTVTDTDGRYELINIQPGPFQLAVSYLGYETFTLNIRVADKNQQVDIRLTPQSQALDNVVVSTTEDKVWKRNLKNFKRHFLGETDYARSSQLVNPWVLEFEKRGSTLLAAAGQPIEVFNPGLGYHVFFYLRQFEASSDAYRIVGPVRFQPINDPAREATWRQNRAEAFRGSVIHFLRALAASNAKEEGFRLYQPINALREEARSLYFERDLGVVIKEMQAKGLVRVDSVSGTYTLTAAKPLEVHFEPGQDYQPVYKDVLHPVSWIQSTTGVVRFDRDGNLLNPTDVIVIGYWNRLRVADLLPLDYRPGQEEAATVQPDVLVVTDKDVYESGEKIWYTVFVTGSRAGSLSVQVDLVDSLNQVIQSRVDPVEWRKATGYFDVPARSGRTCFIRATTNDAYQEGLAYVKPVALLPTGYTWRTEVVGAEITRPLMPQPSLLHRIDTSSTERIVRVWLVDADRDTLSGNFLVAACKPAGAETGLEGRMVTFEKPSVKPTVRDVATGRVTNARGKPLKGRLTLVTTDLAYSIEKIPDEMGSFILDDMVVYDSVEFIAQFFDEKGKPESDFVVTWSERNAFQLPNLAWRTPWRTHKVAGHVLAQKKEDEFKLTDGTRLLKEITVKAKREKSEQPTFRTYGAADWVIKGEDLTGNPAGTNVLSTLIGKVPGLVGSEGGTSWTGFTVKFNVRGNSSLMGATSESPLLILDGMPFDDDQMAYSILQTIPLTDIDRVEVRKGLSPLQATRKGSGAIAIYTKRSGSNESLPNQVPNQFVKKTMLKGYARPAGFSLSGSGAVHTWHWDPYANIGPGGYAFTLPTWLPEVTVRITGFDAAGQLTDVESVVKFAY